MSEDLPEPATPVTTVRMPSGMSTSTFFRLCCVAPRISSAPFGARVDVLEPRPVVEVATGDGARGPQPRDIPGVLDLAARATGARSEVDDVVGDLDDLGLVLDDEHRVALVAQELQEGVHPLDVVRMKPRGRLVEDVADVGEGGSEVADHLGALRLAARQRARGPVEREVAEADVDERVDRRAQALHERADLGVVDRGEPVGEIA